MDVLISVLSSVLGKVRSAVGSAQLLISQKFQQFRGLCEQNLVCIKPFCDTSLQVCMDMKLTPRIPNPRTLFRPNKIQCYIWAILSSVRYACLDAHEGFHTKEN